MYDVYKNDEYREAQVRGLGCAFWALWALGTAGAAVLGELVAATLLRAILQDQTPPLDRLVLAAIPAGALMGAVIGIAQATLIMRYIGAAGFRDWVLASAVGGILRWAGAGPIGYLLLSTLNTSIAVCNLLIPLILYGAAAGAL